MNTKHRFVIDGKFPGMNQWIKAQNNNRYLGAEMKKTNQLKAMAAIQFYLEDLKIENPVVIHYEWYEPNRKRDLDNIAGFGHKVIQDALVETQVLQNDGWLNILGFDDVFFVDKDHPRIVVELEEIDERS